MILLASRMSDAFDVLEEKSDGVRIFLDYGIAVESRWIGVNRIFHEAATVASRGYREELRRRNWWNAGIYRLSAIGVARPAGEWLGRMSG